ncbi:MAG: hypothetical protein Kapaf2KO_08590 [Candidatus Kapaibacteriales bacterium]
MGCEDDSAENMTGEGQMNGVASEYVKLCLQIGQHDKYYIDAYFGPDSLQIDSSAPKTELELIVSRLDSLSGILSSIEIGEEEKKELLKLRKDRLLLHIASAKAVAEKLDGKVYGFEEEARKIYGMDYVPMSLEEINSLVSEVDAILPGSGNLQDRWLTFITNFEIPIDNLESVFNKAIQESKSRTRNFIDLPNSEAFVVEYVGDQPWSAYNWYKGNYYSVIQVNTDIPIYIDRAVDLASHEGYPGHHTYQTLMEKTFVKGYKWPEYLVYPLYSPTSLLSEGLAQYGIDMAFPEEERNKFESEVLMPLANIDTSGFHLYKRISNIVNKLEHAGLYAAAGYMNGNLSKEETKDFLVNNALLTAEKADKRIEFIERFGAYIINYKLGSELVESHIEAVMRGGGSQEQKWAVYLDLLTNPYNPSDLISEGGEGVQ